MKGTLLKNKIVKNYVLNMLYEVFLLIIPIFVTPYVARILGEDGSGQYSYALSIVSYFILFASLGFNYYAQRLIASHQGDYKQQTIDFWEIVLVRLIPCLIALSVYTITILFELYGRKYSVLMFILSINIIAVIFDINFYFQGNEDFEKIVIRSIIIKTISIVCIFLFVKEKNDLWKYTLIQSLSLLFSNITIWIYMPLYLEKIKMTSLHPLKHLRPALILFIPTIALSVYTALDRVLIGAITHMDSENGNYDYAEKLVKMLLTVLTSLGTVLSPRNAKKIADGDIGGVENNIYYTSRFVFFLGIPLMFGTISVADNMIPWYLGPGYNKAALLMKILSPLIIIIGLSNVFGRQFLIPSNQDKKFSIAIICGAITNFFLNLLLINKFKSIGAAIATILSETVVTAVMLMLIRDNIRFLKIVNESKKYWISGTIMFLVCDFFQKKLTPSILHTFEITLIGFVVYILGIILLKDEFWFTLFKKKGMNINV